MRNFFIFGLPRSRTAWLANLFNTERVRCFHLIGVTGQVKEIFEKSGKEYVGMSDPNPQFYAGIKDQFPDAPMAVIERQLTECLESYVAKFNKELDRPLYEFFRNQRSMLDEVAQDGMSKSFDFYDLNTEELWQHLLPDVPFDKERADYLEELNIQTNIQTDDDLAGYLGRVM